MKQIQVGSKDIGDDCPIFVVAEMACSHDGSVNKAKKIIEASAKAKVDAVNFQVFSIKDLMVPQ